MWLDGKMHGQGKFTWPDGRSYVGNYENDQKNGYGTFKWRNGKAYQGEWRNGRQHGEGVLINDPKNEEHERKGIWEDGRLKRWLE